MKIYEINFEDGATPLAHEIRTALFLKSHGKRITFLAPKNQNHIKSPDIRMDGVLWEIKSPISSSARVIEHALRSASKQAPYVIFDLRRCKMPDERALRQIKHEATKRRTTLKRILVITKSHNLIDAK